MNKLTRIAFISAVSLCLNQSTPFAAEPSQRFIQERLVENQKLREMERYIRLAPKAEAILAKEKKLLLDFGGWTDVTYIEFHDDDNSGSTKDVFDADLSVDTRFWVQGIFRPVLDRDYIYEHSVFAQLRNFYISRWPNEEQPAAQDDNDGPHVDLLYADLDLKLAKVRFGRQFLILGQGISYSNVHDGIQVTSSFRNFEVASFFVRTLPHEENIDYSVPGFDKESDRYFTAAQLAWTPKQWARLYSYFLAQVDRSDPKPEIGQDFAYQSQYWGIGSTVSNLGGFSAWAEYILETGSSATFVTNDRENVLAHAVNVGAYYRFPFITHPDVTAEYSFGSGDKERTSVTNTEGGNLRGKDHNFLGFGYLPAGYALAPVLSNIQILRFGTSVRPLEKYWQLKNLSLGADAYFYWKHKELGGIYDVDATDGHFEIGQEVDFTLSWQITSDIITSVRYGVFFPGDAFPLTSNDPETYLSTTLTFIL